MVRLNMNTGKGNQGQASGTSRGKASGKASGTSRGKASGTVGESVAQRLDVRPGSRRPRLGLVWWPSLLILAASMGLAVLGPLRPQGGDTVAGRLGALAISCVGAPHLDSVDWIGASPRMPYWANRSEDGHVRSTFGPGPAWLGAPFMMTLQPGQSLTDKDLLAMARLGGAFGVGLAGVFLYFALLARMGATLSFILTLVTLVSCAGVGTLGQALWQQTAALVPLMAAVAFLSWGEAAPRLLYIVTPFAGLAAVVRPPLALLAGTIVLAALHRAFATSQGPRARAFVLLAFAAGALAVAGLLYFHGVDLIGHQLEYNAAAGGGSAFDWSPEHLKSALEGTFVSWGRGLVWYAPLALVLLVISLFASLQEWRWVTLGVALHLALMCGFFKWWGGFSYGPRLQYELIWIAPAIFALTSWPMRLQSYTGEGTWRIIFAVLAVGQVAVGVLGLMGFQVDQQEVSDPVDRNPSVVWELERSPLYKAYYAMGGPVTTVTDSRPGPFVYCVEATTLKSLAK